MSLIPKISVLKAGNRKYCPFCRHTFKKGEIVMEYIAGSYHQYINLRTMHFDCLLVRHAEFLPSERKRRKLIATRLVEAI